MKYSFGIFNFLEELSSPSHSITFLYSCTAYLRRGGNNTQNNYRKYDLESHDGVVTHLVLDILEYEVKWALGIVTVNKASGGDGIQLIYLKS